MSSIGHESCHMGSHKLPVVIFIRSSKDKITPYFHPGKSCDFSRWKTAGNLRQGIFYSYSLATHLRRGEINGKGGPFTYR